MKTTIILAVLLLGLSACSDNGGDRNGSGAENSAAPGAAEGEELGGLTVQCLAMGDQQVWDQLGLSQQQIQRVEEVRGRMGIASGTTGGNAGSSTTGPGTGSGTGLGSSSSNTGSTSTIGGSAGSGSANSGSSGVSGPGSGSASNGSGSTRTSGSTTGGPSQGLAQQGTGTAGDEQGTRTSGSDHGINGARVGTPGSMGGSGMDGRGGSDDATSELRELASILSQDQMRSWAGLCGNNGSGTSR